MTDERVVGTRGFKGKQKRAKHIRTKWRVEGKNRKHGTEKITISSSLVRGQKKG